MSTSTISAVENIDSLVLADEIEARLRDADDGELLGIFADVLRITPYCVTDPVKEEVSTWRAAVSEEVEARCFSAILDGQIPERQHTWGYHAPGRSHDVDSGQ